MYSAVPAESANWFQPYTGNTCEDKSIILLSFHLVKNRSGKERPGTQFDRVKVCTQIAVHIYSV